VEIEEVAEVLLRNRQALWQARAASCGSNTCPPPDAGTALRLIVSATNLILAAELELRDATTRSFTPVMQRVPLDRPTVERLADKFLLELDELERNVGYMIDGLDAPEADARRLSAAIDGCARAVSTFRVTVGAALLTARE
jgi:hypothetical protein